jgi:hypothetical protein
VTSLSRLEIAVDLRRTSGWSRNHTHWSLMLGVKKDMSVNLVSSEKQRYYCNPSSGPNRRRNWWIQRRVGAGNARFIALYDEHEISLNEGTTRLPGQCTNSCSPFYLERHTHLLAWFHSPHSTRHPKPPPYGDSGRGFNSLFHFPNEFQGRPPASIRQLLV